MANSREQGMKEAAKYYEENMKMFGELRLVRAITEEQIEIMRDPKRAPTAKLPRIEDAVKAGGFLCGNADDLIEHIKALEKKYPALDRISVSLSVGVPEKVALEQLDRGSRKRLCLHSKKPRHRNRCLSADQLNILGRFPPLEPRPRRRHTRRDSTLDMVARGTSQCPDGGGQGRAPSDVAVDRRQRPRKISPGRWMRHCQRITSLHRWANDL